MKTSISSRSLLLAAFFLGACSAQGIILPGERADIREGTIATETKNVAAPIRLSSQTNLSEWSHRAGTSTHLQRHASLSATPVQIWATSVGQGNDRKHRITSDPVAASGRVFTLDSRATTTATAESGAALWSVDLTPASEKSDDASGGGLAVDQSTLFATTGFGELVAMSVSDGSILWRQTLDAPATGAPTVANGFVYVVTRDSRAWAIDASSGRVQWQIQGTPSVSGIVGGAGAAVNSKLAVFPFGSAELIATLPKGGLQVWNSSVSGARKGRAYANVSDVTGDPVLVGNTIYAGNPSGRTVAVDATSGDRIWTAQIGATGPVWVEGSSIFLVSDQAELVRLNAKTGAAIWSVDLPKTVPVRNQLRIRDVFAHFGPVLAGGRLWVASNDGQLRGFDPVSGGQVSSIELPGGAATRPIVVNRTLYVVNQDGQLLAFR